MKNIQISQKLSKLLNDHRVLTSKNAKIRKNMRLLSIFCRKFRNDRYFFLFAIEKKSDVYLKIFAAENHEYFKTEINDIFDFDNDQLRI